MPDLESGQVLAVIPARGGSKGVPRKNLVALSGRSLIQWALDVAIAAQSIGRVVVSSEDPEIIALCERLGAEVVVRPHEMSTGSAPTAPAILHALREVERRSAVRYWAIATLQPTTPFRLPQDIDEAVSMLALSDADAVVGVRRVIDAHPARVKRMVGRELIDYCLTETEGSGRHDYPPAYLRNGAVYVTRREVVEAGSVWGRRQLGYEMPPERSVNIDEPIDLVLAQALSPGSRG